jgi:DNA mismatch repair ATPase MutS
MPSVLDEGPTWALTDQERDDLDLYGPPVGIFGLLNRTSTSLGARRLRDVLDSPGLSPEHIRRRQEAVRWLEQHNQPRLEMMGTLMLLRNQGGKLDRFVRLLHQTQRPPRSILSTAIRLWSAVSAVILVYAVLSIAHGRFLWEYGLVALLLTNVILLRIARSLFHRFDAAVSPWTTLAGTLGCVLAVAEHAERELPDETQLGNLKTHFTAIASNAHIPSLCGWLEWAGLHGAMRAVLNVLVFFDLHIAQAVLARIVPNREILLHGLSAMAELEMLCSLASFSAELPVACYPQPDGDRSLHIEDGRHPLIPAADAVPNSIHLGPDVRTWVITGPNAAGKSTFLRMVGVNVLLAQLGSAAPAREMRWSPVRLITDVRIRDDLARHESYFLSEVRRLRRLVLDAESSTPMFGLIDEPFRGTNSQERSAAGVALLEHLMGSHNLFVIATHEEVLAQTAADVPSAANYHFQEHLRDGGIEFDYLLRPGPAGTKTAIRILEREGYPASLLERARRLTTGGTQNPQPD